MAPPRPLGFWLKLLDQLIDAQFVALLDEHGVSRRQWQLLNVVASGTGATRPQLRAALAPFLTQEEPEAWERALSGLLAGRWLEQRADLLVLTEEGQTSYRRLREVVGRNRGSVTQGISEAEYDQTLQVLERMARNLGWTDPPAPAAGHRS
jgi:hypothetical protein